MDMIIRKAKAEDAKYIYAFVNALEQCRLDYSIFKKYFLRNIADRNSIYLVAVNADKKLTGYLSCHGQLLLHHLSMVFEIQELFVDPRERGKGIGAQLIAKLEERLRRRNGKYLEVTTKLHRNDAKQFYSACGFMHTHRKFTKVLS